MTYNSLDELTERMLDLLFENAEQVSLVAAKAAEAALKRRVFNEGKAADGTMIGQYSTKEARFGESAFAVRGAFRPDAGKRSMLLTGGYAELRRLNGRQANYVDLQYTGSLIRSITTQATGGAHAVVISTNDDAEVARHNEARFGKVVFEAGENELQAIEQAAIFEIERLLNQL